MMTVTGGHRPPRLDNPPLDDGAWKLVQQCWAHDKRLRPGMRDVAETMQSWERLSVLSSPKPPISQSSDSVPRGDHGKVTPSNISDVDSTSGYNASNSDDIPETSPSKRAETTYTTGSNNSSDGISVASLSKKAEKTTPSNYLARAYSSMRTNKKKR